MTTKVKTKITLVMLVLLCVGCNFFESKKRVDSTKKLLGAWYADGYRKSKWVYNKNGTLYNYYDGKLVEAYQYSLSNACGSLENDTIEYIKMIDVDSTEYCMMINDVNKNNNGVLSLKNMDSGETILFVRKVDAVIKP